MITIFKHYIHLFWKNFEMLFWVLALINLGFFTNPYASTDHHFSLCIFKMMGFKSCMGCGIGHAISFLLQGDIQASWDSNFMGTPAVIILLYRIGYLFRKNCLLKTSTPSVKE